MVEGGGVGRPGLNYRGRRPGLALKAMRPGARADLPTPGFPTSIRLYIFKALAELSLSAARAIVLTSSNMSVSSSCVGRPLPTGWDTRRNPQSCVTTEPQSQDPTRLSGSPNQLARALAKYRDAGVSHIALQFVVPRFPERLEQIVRFGRVVPL